MDKDAQQNVQILSSCIAVTLFISLYYSITVSAAVNRWKEKNTVKCCVLEHRMQELLHGNYGKSIKEGLKKRVFRRLQKKCISDVAYVMRAGIQGGPKKLTPFVLYGIFYALISSNIDRFSNLFYCLNQENICSNTVANNPTTHQVCRYTTL